MSSPRHHGKLATAKALFGRLRGTGCKTCNQLRSSHDGTLRLGVKFASFQGPCKFCSLLREMVTYFVPPEHLLAAKLPNLLIYRELGEPIVVSCSGGEPARMRDGNDTIFTFYPKTSASDSHLLARIGSSQEYLSNIDLESSVSFIRESLQMCLEKHSACRDGDESPLPTRLLRIERSSTELVLKLVQAGNCQGRYATLSHCWGAEQPLRTTRLNLDSMLVSIAWDSLPILFQQAISIVEQLQIGFLWIDSLCILQDSREDWELESSRMGAYYANSSITISTVSSPNSTTPFLGDRDRWWWPADFETTDDGGSIHNVQARRIPRPGWESDYGPLFSRAWAFQEAALSRRVLHFTASDMVWECRDAICPRYFQQVKMYWPFGFARRMTILDPADSDAGQPGGARDQQNAHDDSVSSLALRKAWRELIQAFSRRELTFETDKLPALSGVASKFSTRVESRYLAGLWESQLPSQLCWMTTDESPVLRYQYFQYVAPTWSWASISQEVAFLIHEKLRFSPAAVVLSAESRVSGLNPYGTISTASIVLLSKLVRLSLSCDNPQRANGYRLTDSGHWSFMPDCVLAKGGFGITRALSGPSQPNFSSSIFGLFIGSSTVVGLSSKQLYFLALANAGSTDHDYLRLGLATLHVNGRSDFEMKLEHLPQVEVRLV